MGSRMGEPGLAAVLCAALSALSPAAGAAPEEAERLDAVGRVNVAGYSARGHCTGALVAPDKVLTAAHCLKRRDGRPAPLESIHFLPGADRGAYLAHGRAACVAYLESGGGLERDAAVIHLREPIEIAPLAIRDGPAPEIGANVSLAGYPRRRQHMLSIEKSCVITKRRGALTVTNCFAEPGVSGGPLLTIGEDGRAEIFAIAVAVTKTGDTLALPAARWRGLVAGSCRAK